MSSLEKRELQFSNVIDRGEALIAQHHPAMKTIEAHLQVGFWTLLLRSLSFDLIACVLTLGSLGLSCDMQDIV